MNTIAHGQLELSRWPNFEAELLGCLFLELPGTRARLKSGIP